MTGLELLALGKIIKGGADAYAGGKDWLLGDPASKSENSMIKSLKERMSTDLISKGKLQEMLISSSRVPMQMVGNMVNKARGATAFTGMDDSVVSNQVGIQEVAKVTDDVATASLNTTSQVENKNIADKRSAEEQQFALKQLIEQRDKDARSGGFDRMVGGLSGLAETGGQYQNLSSNPTDKFNSGVATKFLQSKDNHYDNEYGAELLKLLKDG